MYGNFRDDDWMGGKSLDIYKKFRMNNVVRTHKIRRYRFLDVN